MSKKEKSHEISRLMILSHLLSFPMLGSRKWESDPGSGFQCIEGDLVTLSSAPSTLWYLSWYVEPLDGYGSHLLRSVETGEDCRWSNVGINRYTEDIPACWRWNDRQHEFNTKWRRACSREDAYIMIPTQCVFDGYQVTLDVRIRFGLSQFSYPRTFKDYRKVLSRDMRSHYLEAVAARDMKKTA